MNKYTMLIANNAPKTENGVYPFSEKNIDNIPYLNIFIEEYANKLITQACKEVLRTSMSSKNQYRYGEIGLLISVNNTDIHGNRIDKIYKKFIGNYKSIEITDEYREIINSRKNIAHDLVFIHNHPNNSTFSYNDINRLYKDEPIIGIVAVGNRHNIHVAVKNGNLKPLIKYINDYAKQYKDSKYDLKTIQDKLIYEIIKNKQYAQYNLEYIKFERRNTK